jgi:hypothetical protein
MSEPGLDVHAWESLWASVADDRDDDPDAAVSQFADIVARMLRERGYDPDNPVAAGGDELELLVAYRSARETAERAEHGHASRTEIDEAIAELEEIFDTVVSNGR